MKQLATLLLTCMMFALTGSIQGQAETFNTKKTMYRVSNGKWRPGLIDIKPNKIEVHKVGTRLRKKELIASFESARVKPEMKKFYRTNEAWMTGITGIGAIGTLMVYKREETWSTHVPSPTGYGPRIRIGGSYTERILDNKKGLIAIGAVAGIVVAIGLSKSEKPYAEITNDLQNIELQVHKRNTSRFMSALETFKANSNHAHK